MTNPSNNSGPQANTEHAQYFDNDLGKVIYLLFARLAKTEEFRNAFFSVALEMLQLWAGESGFKKRIANGIKKSLKKGLLATSAESATNQVAALLGEPGFVKLFGKFLPRFIDNITNTAAALASGVEKLPIKDKEQLFSRPIAETDMGRSGQLVTRVFRIINEIHQEHPVFYADKVHVAFRAFIQNVDFGEVKEAVDNSRDDIAATIRACNNEIWNFPAKIVSILAVIPSLLRIQVIAAEDTIKRLNDIAPDLLTDIVLSLLRQVDAKAIGVLINEITEITRKLHTGSALLGEAGEPRFASDFREMLEMLFSSLDAKLLLDTQTRLADGKQTVNKAILDILRDRPELIKDILTNKAKATTHRAGFTFSKLSLLDELSDDEFADTMVDGLSELELQEIAEIVNLTSTLVNRLANLKPELLGSVATQLAGSIDPYEIQKSTKIITAGVSESFKPIARAVLPSIIKGVCECLRPDDDEFEDEAEQTRAALRELLLGSEVAA